MYVIRQLLKQYLTSSTDGRPPPSSEIQKTKSSPSRTNNGRKDVSGKSDKFNPDECCCGCSSCCSCCSCCCYYCCRYRCWCCCCCCYFPRRTTSAFRISFSRLWAYARCHGSAEDDVDDGGWGRWCGKATCGKTESRESKPQNVFPLAESGSFIPLAFISFIILVFILIWPSLPRFPIISLHSFIHPFIHPSIHPFINPLIN